MAKVESTDSVEAAGLVFAVLLGGVALAALMLLWGGFWTGLTASILWAWFAVPTFGLPAVTIAQAYGLALIVRLFQTHQHSRDTDKGWRSIFKAILKWPLYAGVFLGLGWCAKTWFM